MIRAYKFLMRPTVGQAQALGEMLRDHCSLYNGALQERRDAYRHISKTSIRYGDQSAQLKDIRAFDPERHGRWSFSSQQATLRRLDKAFQASFRRVKSGDTPGYPRFRGVSWFDTVDFPKDGDGRRWSRSSGGRGWCWCCLHEHHDVLNVRQPPGPGRRGECLLDADREGGQRGGRRRAAEQAAARQFGHRTHRVGLLADGRRAICSTRTSLVVRDRDDRGRGVR